MATSLAWTGQTAAAAPATGAPLVLLYDRVDSLFRDDAVPLRWAHGQAGDQHLLCDWDGDGVDTLGVFRPAEATWYLRNEPGGGVADESFRYGRPGPTDRALCGDWDGDGVDTPGIYRSADSTWHLTDRLGPGSADRTFRYGSPGGGDAPVSGDWDGDGVDTVGVYRISDSTWHLHDTNAGGAAAAPFRYGGPEFHDVPLTGDWDGDGIDTVGVLRRLSGYLMLRNSNRGGRSDGGSPPLVVLGPTIAGDHDGDGDDAFGIVDQPGEERRIAPSGSAAPRDLDDRRIYLTMGGDLLAMNPDGSDRQVIRPDVTGSVGLSHDGSVLVYVCGGHVCTAQADGSGERAIFPTEWGHGSVGVGVISPDNQRLTYHAGSFEGGGRWATGVMGIDGADPNPVTLGRVVLDWSPDGTWLLTTAFGPFTFAGRGNIEREDLVTGEARQIGGFCRCANRFMLSHDGHLVAFEQLEDVWVVPVSGGDAVQITDHESQEFFPLSWEPTGTLLVDRVAPDGTHDLIRLTVDGDQVGPPLLTTTEEFSVAA